MVMVLSISLVEFGKLITQGRCSSGPPPEIRDSEIRDPEIIRKKKVCNLPALGVDLRMD